MPLDSSNLKNMSMREKLIVVFTLVFAVGYGYYEFEYAVQKKNLKKIKADLIQVNASVGAFQTMMKSPEKVKKTREQIEKVKEEISEFEEAIDKAKGRLKGQDLEILDELQNEADFYGVFLKSMRSTEKHVRRNGLKMKEVSLIMEMESEYDALKNFISSLSNSPAVIDIESLETKRVEKILPKVESRLHLKVMVL